MAVAVLVLFGIPLMLLVIGALTIRRAIVSLRGRPANRAAGILRIIAGAGVMVCALISAAGLVVEVQYAVVAFPLLGMVGALVWGLGFLGAAGITEHVARGRSTGWTQ